MIFEQESSKDRSESFNLLATSKASQTLSFGVNLSETNWHELGIHPNTHRFEAAAKAAKTRKRHSEECGA